MEGLNCSDLRPACSIKDFAHCQDTAHGAVFIIASGSSARGFPIERFSDVPMITMNGAISMFIDTRIKPYFYACTDTSFPRQQPKLFAQALRLSQQMAFWKEQLEDLPFVPFGDVYMLKKAPRASFLQSLFERDAKLIRHRSLWDRRGRSLGFSKDLTAGFFDARTVAYLALQIAYHAGFSKVFLVGVDLNPASGRFYENGDGVVSPCGLDHYFDRRILPSLRLMADRVVGNRFAVYNLSPTSRIPDSVIPKITIDEAAVILAAKD